MKAQAKDYIRESQVRLILKPLVEQVLFELSPQGLESQLRSLLARLRTNHPRKPGYVGGNTVNLLLHLNDRLSHWDFSDLSIWQAYLQNVDLHDVNFAYSDFIRSNCVLMGFGDWYLSQNVRGAYGVGLVSGIQSRWQSPCQRLR